MTKTREVTISERPHRAVFVASHGEGPWKCHFCKRSVSIDVLHVHHIDEDPQNNDLSNLAPTHGRCHASYHSRARRGNKQPSFALSADDTARLLRTAETVPVKYVPNGKERNYALIAVGLDCGLRVSEMSALNRSDIDWEDAVIEVWHGKGNKHRTVPMTDHVAAALRRYLSTRDDDNPAVFLSRRRRRMSIPMMRHTIRKLGDAAGLKKMVDGHPARMSPHKLRHTFITDMLDAEVPLPYVQRVAGHANASMTAKYYHVRAGRDYVQRLQRPSL